MGSLTFIFLMFWVWVSQLSCHSLICQNCWPESLMCILVFFLSSTGSIYGHAYKQLDSYVDAIDPNLEIPLCPWQACYLSSHLPSLSIRILNILISRFDAMCIEKTEVKFSSVKLLHMFPATGKMLYLWFPMKLFWFLKY